MKVINTRESCKLIMPWAHPFRVGGGFKKTAPQFRGVPTQHPKGLIREGG